MCKPTFIHLLLDQKQNHTTGHLCSIHFHHNALFYLAMIPHGYTNCTIISTLHLMVDLQDWKWDSIHQLPGVISLLELNGVKWWESLFPMRFITALSVVFHTLKENIIPHHHAFCNFHATFGCAHVSVVMYHMFRTYLRHEYTFIMHS